MQRTRGRQARQEEEEEEEKEILSNGAEIPEESVA
jgi:hypothetical protein